MLFIDQLLSCNSCKAYALKEGTLYSAITEISITLYVFVEPIIKLQ